MSVPDPRTPANGPDHYVTGTSTVHADWCGQLRRADNVMLWTPQLLSAHDKACRLCLPEGLPT